LARSAPFFAPLTLRSHALFCTTLYFSDLHAPAAGEGKHGLTMVTVLLLMTNIGDDSRITTMTATRRRTWRGWRASRQRRNGLHRLAAVCR